MLYESCPVLACQLWDLNPKKIPLGASASKLSSSIFCVCFFEKIMDLKLDNNWTTLPCFYCKKQLIVAIIGLHAKQEIKNDWLRAWFPTSSTQNIHYCAVTTGILQIYVEICVSFYISEREIKLPNNWLARAKETFLPNNKIDIRRRRN